MNCKWHSFGMCKLYLWVEEEKAMRAQPVITQRELTWLWLSNQPRQSDHCCLIIAPLQTHFLLFHSTSILFLIKGVEQSKQQKKYVDSHCASILQIFNQPWRRASAWAKKQKLEFELRSLEGGSWEPQRPKMSGAGSLNLKFCGGSQDHLTTALWRPKPNSNFFLAQANLVVLWKGSKNTHKIFTLGQKPCKNWQVSCSNNISQHLKGHPRKCVQCKALKKINQHPIKQIQFYESFLGLFPFWSDQWHWIQEFGSIQQSVWEICLADRSFQPTGWLICVTLGLDRQAAQAESEEAECDGGSAAAPAKSRAQLPVKALHRSHGGVPQ